MLGLPVTLPCCLQRPPDRVFGSSRCTWFRLAAPVRRRCRAELTEPASAQLHGQAEHSSARCACMPPFGRWLGLCAWPGVLGLCAWPGMLGRITAASNWTGRGKALAASRYTAAYTAMKASSSARWSRSSLVTCDAAASGWPPLPFTGPDFFIAFFRFFQRQVESCCAVHRSVATMSRTVAPRVGPMGSGSSPRPTCDQSRTPGQRQ